MSNLIIDNINDRLNRRGRTLDGRAILRIVWSADQFEKRIGKFEDYYGHIFLREVTQLRTVPKYHYLTPPCFILERLCFLPPGAAIHRELVEASNGTYEPIYAFRHPATRQPLEVNDRVVDMILWHLENPGPKRNEDDARREYEAELQRDADYFALELEEAGRSPLFAHESSTFLDSKKRTYYKEKGITDGISKA